MKPKVNMSSNTAVRSTKRCVESVDDVQIEVQSVGREVRKRIPSAQCLPPNHSLATPKQIKKTSKNNDDNVSSFRKIHFKCNNDDGNKQLLRESIDEMPPCASQQAVVAKSELQEYKFESGILGGDEEVNSRKKQREPNCQKRPHQHTEEKQPKLQNDNIPCVIEAEKVRELFADANRRNELVQKASSLLKDIGENDKYCQEPGDVEQTNNKKSKYDKDKDFFGEPVPSDDDEALFNAGAGAPKKKPKLLDEEPEEPLPEFSSLELDYYNADTHIQCETTKLKSRWYIVNPVNAEGLALMWGGVKSTFGLPLPYSLSFPDKHDNLCDQMMQVKTTNRRVVFQVKLCVRHLPCEEHRPHDIRVGFSAGSTSNILGESKFSWCVTSSAKRATMNIFTLFLKSEFGVNDVITAIFDVDESTISFRVNNEDSVVAFSDVVIPKNDALFPTISVKNYQVAVNLGNCPPDVDIDDWPNRDPTWTFFSELDQSTLQHARLPPPADSPVAVIMTVGLPASGKTTYVKNYLRDHPDEPIKVISSDVILSQMRVDGVSRSRAHIGRWDTLMGLVAKAVRKYISMAPRRRRNYIIDGTNCSRDARKKKLANFQNYWRQCLIFIPSDEEWQHRLKQQARDQNVVMPSDSILELKAVFAIPDSELENWNEIIFIEPTAELVQQAVELVSRYNEEGAGYYSARYGRKQQRRIHSDGSAQQSVPWSSSHQSHQTPVQPSFKSENLLTIRWLDDASPLSASASSSEAANWSTTSVSHSSPEQSAGNSTLPSTRLSTPSSSRAVSNSSEFVPYKKTTGIPRSFINRQSHALQNAYDNAKCTEPATQDSKCALLWNTQQSLLDLAQPPPQFNAVPTQQVLQQSVPHSIEPSQFSSQLQQHFSFVQSAAVQQQPSVTTDFQNIFAYPPPCSAAGQQLPPFN